MSGEVRELHIPSSEAYGDKGMPNFQIPPGSDLVFEIEVLKIEWIFQFHAPMGPWKTGAMENTFSENTSSTGVGITVWEIVLLRINFLVQ